MTKSGLLAASLLHNDRRPGEQPGPIRRGLAILKHAVRRLSRNDECLWLWVPAFAGTTGGAMTATDQRPALFGARESVRLTAQRTSGDLHGGRQ
jgi:hypothetical protein